MILPATLRSCRHSGWAPFANRHSRPRLALILPPTINHRWYFDILIIGGYFTVSALLFAPHTSVRSTVKCDVVAMQRRSKQQYFGYYWMAPWSLQKNCQHSAEESILRLKFNDLQTTDVVELLSLSLSLSLSFTTPTFRNKPPFFSLAVAEARCREVERW